MEIATRSKLHVEQTRRWKLLGSTLLLGAFIVWNFSDALPDRKAQAPQGGQVRRNLWQERKSVPSPGDRDTTMHTPTQTAPRPHEDAAFIAAPASQPALPSEQGDNSERERFAEATVRAAVEAGLDELAVDAHVTAVYCTELPCIITGINFGSREDADALRATDALSVYEDDARTVFGWNDGHRDGGADRWSFAVAIYPHLEGDQDEDMRDLVEHRLQMIRSTTPGPTRAQRVIHE